jgi:hypothetical protein
MMYIWVMTSSVKFGWSLLLLMTSAVEGHACLMSGTMRLKSLMFDTVFSVAERHSQWSNASDLDSVHGSESGSSIWKNVLIFFDQKLQFTRTYPLASIKGRPSYRRGIEPSKENIQHFKTWNFLPFFYFCGSFFALLDLDPLTWSNSDPDPDPKHCNEVDADCYWKVAVLMGADKETAAAQLWKVIEFEVRIAKISIDEADRHDTGQWYRKGGAIANHNSRLISFLLLPFSHYWLRPIM